MTKFELYIDTVSILHMFCEKNYFQSLGFM